MAKKLTTALLITAAAFAVPISVGAGGASAAVGDMLPLGQCRAEAAQLNSRNAPEPGSTHTSFTTYYCFENVALGGYGVVRERNGYI